MVVFSAMFRGMMFTAVCAGAVLPAQAAPPARDACAILPQAKIAPILGAAFRQDQPPKRTGAFIASACIFANGRDGAAAQVMLMTYPDPASALAAAPRVPSTDTVAGVQAVWDGNFLHAGRGNERFMIMPLSHLDSEKRAMAKAILAVALATH
jgi:hypothetical protein